VAQLPPHPLRSRLFAAWRRLAVPLGRRRPPKGQAMVEFAAVLLPLLLIVVAIIQFGFLFAAYVGVSNAARDGARSGTIYVYDRTLSPAQNDGARCSIVLSTSQQSLDTGVPGQFSGSCATTAGGGDLLITYPDGGSCTNQPRKGCQLRVALTYRQPLFVPLIGGLIGADASNRVGFSAAVTMVVN
jgi:hypothetical protein